MKQKLVYLITNPAWPGWIKIGIASSHKARLSVYQTGSPFRDYKIVGGITTPHWKAVENALHNHFNSEYEWVEASIDDAKTKLKYYINYYESKKTESDSGDRCNEKTIATGLQYVNPVGAGNKSFRGYDPNNVSSTAENAGLHGSHSGNRRGTKSKRSLYPGDVHISEFTD